MHLHHNTRHRSSSTRRPQRIQHTMQHQQYQRTLVYLLQLDDKRSTQYRHPNQRTSNPDPTLLEEDVDEDLADEEEYEEVADEHHLAHHQQVHPWHQRVCQVAFHQHQQTNSVQRISNPYPMM